MIYPYPFNVRNTLSDRKEQCYRLGASSGSSAAHILYRRHQDIRLCQSNGSVHLAALAQIIFSPIADIILISNETCKLRNDIDSICSVKQQCILAPKQFVLLFLCVLFQHAFASQPVSQSASQPVSQSASQPVSQSASQPVSQSASQPVSQSASQPVSQSASQPVSQRASTHQIKIA